jgi:hypothetical protein
MMLLAGYASTANGTLRRDPITLSRDSVSAVEFGLNVSDVFQIVSTPGRGFDVAPGEGPSLHISRLSYGALIDTPGASDNTSGLSNGEVYADRIPVLYLSVSSRSSGLPGTEVNHQALRAQHAADRFTAGVSRSPLDAITFGQASANNLRLSINQTWYNAWPSIDPVAFNASGKWDDADALEVDQFKASGDLFRTSAIYFALDEQSPTLQNNLAGEAWSPADILHTPVGTQFASRFASASTMGLNALHDALDGLAVYDRGVPGVFEPGVDLAVFSLAGGSTSLGATGSGADLFVTDFTGDSVLYVSHSDLGLRFEDEVDAVDVDYRDGTSMAYGLILTPLPEPASLALLAFAAVMLRRQ